MLPPSEDHILLWLYRESDENKIDATFIALGIYLKLSNIWFATLVFAKTMNDGKQNFWID